MEEIWCVNIYISIL